MLVLINRYFRSRNTTTTTTTTTNNNNNNAAGGGGGDEMAPAAAASADSDHLLCLPGCVPVRAKRAASATSATVTTTTTARASRHNFVKAAASGLLAGAQFTNHESLPPLPDAYAEFAAAFPQYAQGRADAIRGDEYQHLDRHVCLDYTGINLFSHAQMNSSLPSTSSAPPPPSSSSSSWQPPFFDIAYKSTSLRTQVEQCGDTSTSTPTTSTGGIGAAVTRRIMASLKIPSDEYAMVCTANRTTAFRLLAESYSFQPGKRLLPVYDYESEAVSAMASTARRRGADVVPATFAWPSMRIHGADLRKRLSRGPRRRRGTTRGLFVFPLASRMTGARYPYLWMSAAHEQGWHVALDACALGTKDLDTFGLSLIRPDFIVCNFFKVFGENPSGFAGLFVKRTSLAALERSVIARSIGVVSIVPARRWSLHDGGYSTELEHSRSFPTAGAAAAGVDDVDVETTSSFSGPLSSTAITRSRTLQSEENGDAAHEIREVDDGGTAAENNGGVYYSEPEPPPRAENGGHGAEQPRLGTKAAAEEEGDGEGVEVECRGLDHADALGLIAIGNRLRCISNWLVVALQKLRHPHAGDSNNGGGGLVRLYGPRVKFDRGPSLAFNVFDWKGERVSPLLVQKLADRHNISLTCGFLCNIWFSDKYDADRAAVLEHRVAGDSVVAAAAVGGAGGGKKRKDNAAGDVGILVVNASLGFLSNFEDAYRLWAFVAKFLDADFVEKERWRYTALNQRTVEV